MFRRPARYSQDPSQSHKPVSLSMPLYPLPTLGMASLGLALPHGEGRANPPEALAAVDNKALSNTSLSPATLTIEPEVFKAAICKIVFHDGHERGHLTEQQHFVVGGPEFGKNSIEQLEFP